MSAMQMNADLTSKPEIVLASVGTAVVAASAALMFALTLTKTWAMVVAADVGEGDVIAASG
jgi:NO-binding membrane sensor protein with MHYT domain